MSMASENNKEQRRSTKAWRIFQKWGSNKAFVGIVIAQDSQTAIETAILRYKITDPEHQKRLIAEPRGD